jgi:hypothetical protein
MGARKGTDLPRNPDAGSPPAATRSPAGDTGWARMLVQQSAPDVGPRARHEMIAQVAYMLAQARGFAPGHELDDWLSAEAEVDRALAAREPVPAQQRRRGIQ